MPCKAGSILLSNQRLPDLMEHLAPSGIRALVTEYQIQFHFRILPFISGPIQLLPLISGRV